MTTSVRIVGTAAACGLVLALLFTQSLSTMLYGVSRPTRSRSLASSSSSWRSHVSPRCSGRARDVHSADAGPTRGVVAMSWLRRLRTTLRPARHHRDIDRELAFHIAERVDQLRAEGLTESEAQRRARLQFGNPVVQRERTRDVDIAHGMDTLLRHVRYARSHSPSARLDSQLTVVLTLALGIGANSAVFSAMDAVLLRPLPFPDSDRLMRLRQVQETESIDRSASPGGLEPPELVLRSDLRLSTSRRYRTRPATFRNGSEGPSWLRASSRSWASRQHWDVVQRRRVSSRRAASVLISDRYWKTRLASDPQALGTVIRIEDRSYSIVGVLPADFTFPDRDVDLWWPYPTDGPLAQDNAGQQAASVVHGHWPAQSLAQVSNRHMPTWPLFRVNSARQFPDTDASRRGPHRAAERHRRQPAYAARCGSCSARCRCYCSSRAPTSRPCCCRAPRDARTRSRSDSRLAPHGRPSPVSSSPRRRCSSFAGAAAGLLLRQEPRRRSRSLRHVCRVSNEIGIEPRMLIYTMAAPSCVALLCGLLPAIRSVRNVASATRESSARCSSAHRPVAAGWCASRAVRHAAVGRRAPRAQPRGAVPRRSRLRCRAHCWPSG